MSAMTGSERVTLRPTLRLSAEDPAWEHQVAAEVTPSDGWSMDLSDQTSQGPSLLGNYPTLSYHQPVLRLP